MTTVAKPTTPDAAHWYTKSGEPMHTVIAKGSKQPRRTTLADARRLRLMPSVTTVLKILYKKALEEWKIEQSCLAVLTTPRKPGEELDAFVERVLHTERVQDEEGKAARELGTLMHCGLETYFQGGEVHEDLLPWILPAAQHLTQWLSHVEGTEEVVCGGGYAGTIDLLGCADTELGVTEILVDFKTAKRLPTRGSWPEHRLQLAAYAAATSRQIYRPIKTANLYISTMVEGEFVLHINPQWEPDYENGFLPLLKIWCHMNNYNPLK